MVVISILHGTGPLDASHLWLRVRSEGPSLSFLAMLCVLLIQGAHHGVYVDGLVMIVCHFFFVVGINKQFL